MTQDSRPGYFADGGLGKRPACAIPATQDAVSDNIVRDSNGKPLAESDAVLVIKDLKVKGSSVTLKRGTVIRNVRLNGTPGEVEANHEKVRGLVLKTEFLRKA